MSSEPLWLEVLHWALAGLAAWLVLSVILGLAVGKIIAFAARRLLCRPGRSCRLCERATCVITPCCPHCPWDPTNDQM